MSVIQAMVQRCCRQVTEGTFPGETGKGLCRGMDHGSLLQAEGVSGSGWSLRHERWAGGNVRPTLRRKIGEEKKVVITQCQQEIRQEVGSQQT